MLALTVGDTIEALRYRNPKVEEEVRRLFPSKSDAHILILPERRILTKEWLRHLRREGYFGGNPDGA